MNAEAVKWAWSVTNVSGTEKLVLLSIAAHANQVGLSWPGMNLLASECCLSERTVRTAVGSLRASGIVEVSSSDGRVHQYRLPLNDAKPRQEVPEVGEFAPRQTPPPSPANAASLPGKPFRGPRQEVPGNKKVLKDNIIPNIIEARGTRLPAGWVPEPNARRFAVDLGLNPDAVLEQFRDYWRALPGTKGSKLDWTATWRNWCRNQRPARGSALVKSEEGWPQTVTNGF
jgi:hypothetical protein